MLLPAWGLPRLTVRIPRWKPSSAVRIKPSTLLNGAGETGYVRADFEREKLFILSAIRGYNYKWPTMEEYL